VRTCGVSLLGHDLHGMHREVQELEVLVRPVVESLLRLRHLESDPCLADRINLLFREVHEPVVELGEHLRRSEALAGDGDGLTLHLLEGYAGRVYENPNLPIIIKVIKTQSSVKNAAAQALSLLFSLVPRKIVA